MKKLFCLLCLVMGVACQNQLEVKKTGSVGGPPGGQVEGRPIIGNEHLPLGSSEFIFALGEGSNRGDFLYYNSSTNSEIEIPGVAGQIYNVLENSRYYLALDVHNKYSFFNTDQGLMEFNHTSKSVRNVDIETADGYTYVSGDSLIAMGASGYKLYQGGESAPLELNSYFEEDYSIYDPISYGKGYYLVSAGYGDVPTIIGPKLLQDSSPIFLDQYNTPELLGRTDQSALLASMANLYLLNYATGTNQRILGVSGHRYQMLGYTPDVGYVALEVNGDYPTRVLLVNSLTGAYDAIPFPAGPCYYWDIDMYVGRGMNKLLINYLNGCEGSSSSLLKGSVIDLISKNSAPFEMDTASLAESFVVTRSIGNNFLLFSGDATESLRGVHYLNQTEGSFELGPQVDIKAMVENSMCLTGVYPMDCSLINIDDTYGVVISFVNEPLIALDYRKEVLFIEAYDSNIDSPVSSAVVYDKTTNKLYPYMNFLNQVWMSALFSN